MADPRARSASMMPDPRRAMPADASRRNTGASAQAARPSHLQVAFGQDPRKAQPAGGAQQQHQQQQRPSQQQQPQPVAFGQDPRKAQQPQQQRQQQPQQSQPIAFGQDPRRAQAARPSQQQQPQQQRPQDPRQAKPAGSSQQQRQQQRPQPIAFGQDPRRQQAKPGVRHVALAAPGSTNSLSKHAFPAETRKLLKLEFAKADRNRDGWLTSDEFETAYSAAVRLVPALKQIPRTVAMANYKANATASGLNINSFLHMMEQMNASVSSREFDEAVPMRGGGGHDRQGRRKSMTVKDVKRRASSTMRNVGAWFGLVDTDMEVLHQQQNRRMSSRRRPAQPANGIAAANVSSPPPVPEELRLEDFAPAAKPTGRLIYDYDQALEHYRRYVQREKTANRSKMKNEWHGAGHAGGDNKRVGGAAPKRKIDRAEINAKLRSLPTFKPYFIPMITFVQFAILLGMCANAWQLEEFGSISLQNKQEFCAENGDTSGCPSSLECTSCPNEHASRIVKGNMWIGPDIRYLISFGAKFTPCMRHDRQIEIKLAAQRQTECGVTGNQCETSDVDDGYSCCTTATARNGMTNKTYCTSLGGTWDAEASLTKEYCDPVTVDIRPCCTGSTGDCEIITEDDCAWRDGVFHKDAQLCSEVNCLAETCKLRTGETIGTDPDLPNQPEKPNQWYRFILPIFIHAGAIHFALLAIVQWSIGKTMEKSIGFLRIFLIYFISGIGGYVVSGIFASTQVDVGSDPAVFGLLAVLIVELFQSWQIVPNKWKELSKLLFLIAIALLIGTFPFVDNFGHVGGFLFGVPAAIVFLPYITFGKWDLARKRVLLIVCVPLLMFMFVIGIVTFYEVQNTDFCSWCESINCIQYTSDIACETF